MGYWVYGNDRDTGARTHFYSDADDEEAARVQASEQGMFVERLELARQAPPPEPEPTVYVPPARIEPRPPSTFTWSGLALGIAELISVIACGGSLFYLAFMIPFFSRSPGQAMLGVGACLLSFCYNAAMTIVFDYVRQQIAIRR